jgi:hypothetical protein
MNMFLLHEANKMLCKNFVFFLDGYFNKDFNKYIL